MSIISQLETAARSYQLKATGEEAEDPALKFKRAVERALCGRQGLVIAAVTSRVQASFRSDETPYGAGKTTLAMQKAYHYCGFDPESKRYIWLPGQEEQSKLDFRNWGEVNAHIYDSPGRSPGQLLGDARIALKDGKRIKVAIWDDVQKTAPSESGKSRDVALLVGEIQQQRLSMGLLILTFPSVHDIAHSISNLIQYEFIVYQQGKYELQMYHRSKNFKAPRKDWERLEYLSGDPGGEQEFAALPPEEQKWYDDWRMQRMIGPPVNPRHRFDAIQGLETPPFGRSDVPSKPNPTKGRWGE